MPGTEDAEASGHRPEVLAALGSLPPTSCLGPEWAASGQTAMCADHLRVSQLPWLSTARANVPAGPGAGGDIEGHQNSEKRTEGLWVLTLSLTPTSSLCPLSLSCPRLPHRRARAPGREAAGPSQKCGVKRKYISFSGGGKKSVGTSSFSHPTPSLRPAVPRLPSTGLPPPPWPL